MKRLSKISLLLIISTLLVTSCTLNSTFECKDPLGCIDIMPDDPVHIAYLLPTDGINERTVEDLFNGLDLAISDRGGKILDHKIILTGRNSGCNVETANSSAKKLIENKNIIGIIGPACSSSAVASIDLISEAGTVMISPIALGPQLTDPEGSWQPGFYRLINDKEQGSIAAEFAYNAKRENRTAVTIYNNDPYSKSLSQSFFDTFTDLGGVVSAIGPFEFGKTDFRDIISEIAKRNPDVIFLPIFLPEASYIIDQFQEFDELNDVVLIGADGLFTNRITDLGQAAIDMYIIGPNVPDGKTSLEFDAFAYDATNLLLDAIINAAIKDKDGTLHIPRSAVRNAMTSTSNFDGLTGTLSCDEFGDCGSEEVFAIYQLTTDEVLENKWPPSIIYAP